jgi:hypothetical protein
MVKKLNSRKHHTVHHVITRLKERYGIRFKREDIKKITEEIQQSGGKNFLESSSNNASIHAVFTKYCNSGIYIPYIYDRDKHQIVTALPANQISGFLYELQDNNAMQSYPNQELLKDLVKQVDLFKQLGILYEVEPYFVRDKKQIHKVDDSKIPLIIERSIFLQSERPLPSKDFLNEMQIQPNEVTFSHEVLDTAIEYFGNEIQLIMTRLEALLPKQYNIVLCMHHGETYPQDEIVALTNGSVKEQAVRVYYYYNTYLNNTGADLLCASNKIQKLLLTAIQDPKWGISTNSVNKIATFVDDLDRIAIILSSYINKTLAVEVEIIENSIATINNFIDDNTVSLSLLNTAIQAVNRVRYDSNADSYMIYFRKTLAQILQLTYDISKGILSLQPNHICGKE